MITIPLAIMIGLTLVLVIWAIVDGITIRITEIVYWGFAAIICTIPWIFFILGLWHQQLVSGLIK